MEKGPIKTKPRTVTIELKNTDAYKSLVTEIKLSINKKLYDVGLITEEMYIKAKEKFILS